MNLKELRERLAAASKRVQEAADAIERAGDDADLDALRRDLDEAVADAERAKAQIEQAESVQRARDAFPVAPADEAPARGAEAPVVRVGQEPMVYRERGDHSFFSDAYRMRFLGDSDAGERIMRHGRQMVDLYRDRGIELRDVGTAAFAGLTVPQYLIDLVAPLARAGRPYANTIRSLPLPASGMVISVSRITTGSAVAAQASENAAVQETDLDDTKLDIDVRTYAGMQDVSRQALERSEMVEEIVFADLVSDYHTKLDAACLNGAGTSGTHLGLRATSGTISVTYTDGTPTVPEMYPKIADAIQQVNGTRFMPAEAIIMHPRRWGFFTAALDTTNRPLVVPNSSGPFNAAAVGKAAEYGQVVGTLHGLPVVTDANILTNLGAGTNEDEIYVIRSSDHLLWEEGDGMPRRLRFEETLGGNLTVKLVVYGYSAYSNGRYPAATAKIGGTGLAAPTF